MVVITQGMQALGEAFIRDVVVRLQTFVAFEADNDPYHEHDFGVLVVEGDQIYFKIDYYNLERDGLSSDPTDQDVTARVRTIMFSSEYSSLTLTFGGMRRGPKRLSALFLCKINRVNGFDPV